MPGKSADERWYDGGDMIAEAFENAKDHHRRDRDYLEQIKAEATADAQKRARTFAELMKDVTATGVHVRTNLVLRERGGIGNSLAVNRRRLIRHDGKTAKTPFQYHGSALAQIRPDQVPRVLAALTEADDLELKELELDALTAAQNRVDPDKVTAIAGSARFKKPAVVVHIGNGRNLIVDGHHRLAAEWLKGSTAAIVRYKDVGRMSNALKGMGEDAEERIGARICKVDEGHGLVLGYAIVCKQDGEDYYDLQGDHIPEDAMLGASVDFMLKSRAAKEMHAGDAKGSIVFAWPLTSDIAEAFGIVTKTTGLLIAMKPDDPAMLAKFRDGTFTGFSIGGSRITDEDVV